eukprot:scaffold50372_cov20-Tisochrysis_lutea.AAC.2
MSAVIVMQNTPVLVLGLREAPYQREMVVARDEVYQLREEMAAMMRKYDQMCDANTELKGKCFQAFARKAAQNLHLMQGPGRRWAKQSLHRLLEGQAHKGHPQIPSAYGVDVQEKDGPSRVCTG